MIKKSLYLGILATGAMLLSAMPTMAATPQEILNNSLTKFNTEKGYRVVGQVVVDVNETRFASADKSGPESASFTIDFFNRALPKQDDTQDSEGRLVLSKAQIKGDGQVLELDEPLSFQWRVLKPTFYGQFEKIPTTILNFLKPSVDLTPLVNQWLKTDMPEELTQLRKINEQTEKVDEMTTLAQEMADKQAFIITRIEKKYNNPEGDDMIRVRLAINRNLLYKEYLNNLKEAYKIKTYKERLAKINELRKEYNETIAEIKKISAAANINLTKQRLARIEMGMSQRDPKQDCTWNEKTNKSVCKQIGWTNVKLVGGLTFMPVDTSPINIPYNAIDVAELENLF